MNNKPHPSRYSTSPGIEGSFEPGSDGNILRNKLGITSEEEMDNLEYLALLKVQAKYYRKISPQTQFTAALLCQMHQDFLGRIYEWAGRYRSVELEKDGFPWPPAYLVADNMRTFEKDMLAERTPCVPGPIERVAEDIAVVHAEFLLVHPFRDGNGRLARLTADLMSLQAGFPALDFGLERVDEMQEYIKAVQSGYLRDYGHLTALVKAAIERSLSHFSG